MLTKSDLAVFESLSIITLDGFEPERSFATDELGQRYEISMVVDRPGSANWLLIGYGTNNLDLDPTKPGILWADYEMPGWQFRVLIASDEVEALSKTAEESGYTVSQIQEVDEPGFFGDGHQGTVAILKHPEGWVIAQ